MKNTFHSIKYTLASFKNRFDRQGENEWKCFIFIVIVIIIIPFSRNPSYATVIHQCNQYQMHHIYWPSPFNAHFISNISITRCANSAFKLMTKSSAMQTDKNRFCLSLSAPLLPSSSFIVVVSTKVSFLLISVFYSQTAKALHRKSVGAVKNMLI